jgi:hypothetical protein
MQGLDGPEFESRSRKVFSSHNTYRSALKSTQPRFHEYRSSLPGNSGRSVMLSTHLHLAPKLRLGAAVTPLPLSAFMAYTLKNISFYLIHDTSNKTFYINYYN